MVKQVHFTTDESLQPYAANFLHVNIGHQRNYKKEMSRKLHRALQNTSLHMSSQRWTLRARRPAQCLHSNAGTRSAAQTATPELDTKPPAARRKLSERLRPTAGTANLASSNEQQMKAPCAQRTHGRRRWKKPPQSCTHAAGPPKGSESSERRSCPTSWTSRHARRTLRTSHCNCSCKTRSLQVCPRPYRRPKM